MQPSRDFRPIFFDLATVEDGSQLHHLIQEGPGNIENVSTWLAGHSNEYTRNDSQALANIALRLAHFANRSSSDPQIRSINDLAHTVFNRYIKNNSNGSNRHAADPDQEEMDLSSFDSDSNPNNSNSNSAPSSNRAVKRGDLLQKDTENRSSKKRVKETDSSSSSTSSSSATSSSNSNPSNPMDTEPNLHSKKRTNTVLGTMQEENKKAKLMAELTLERFPENLRPQVTSLVETIKRGDKALQIADLLHSLYQKLGEGIILYLSQLADQSTSLTFEILEAFCEIVIQDKLEQVPNEKKGEIIQQILISLSLAKSEKELNTLLPVMLSFPNERFQQILTEAVLFIDKEMGAEEFTAVLRKIAEIEQDHLHRICQEAREIIQARETSKDAAFILEKLLTCKNPEDRKQIEQFKQLKCEELREVLSIFRFEFMDYSAKKKNFDSS